MLTIAFVASAVRVRAQASTGGVPPDSGALTQALASPRWPGLPLRFSTREFDVVVTTPLSRAWLAAHDSPRAIARACTGLALVPRDTARGAQFVDWKAAEGVVASDSGPAGDLDDAIVITIAPVAPSPSPCRGHPAQSPASIAEGVVFQRTAFHDPGGDIARINLLVNGETRAPLRTERAIQRVVVPRTATVEAPASTVARMFVGPEDFLPDAKGRLNMIQIAVARPLGQAPIIVRVPSDVSSQVHQDLLTHAILGAATGESVPTLVLPPSSDPGLRRAIALERSGDTRGAALLYHARLYDPALDEPAVREARVRLALALAALGDSGAARAIGARVVQRDPCFTLASSLPSGARALFPTAVPSRARCVDDVRGVMTRSVLLPGLGQVYAGRKVTGFGVALATGLAFGVSGSRLVASRGEYDRYLTANTDFDARKWYRRAGRSRDDALRATIAGASIWLAGAIEATLVERRHADAMRMVRDYGLRITAGPMHGGVGVTVSRP